MPGVTTRIWPVLCVALTCSALGGCGRKELPLPWCTQSHSVRMDGETAVVLYGTVGAGGTRQNLPMVIYVVQDAEERERRPRPPALEVEGDRTFVSAGQWREDVPLGAVVVVSGLREGPHATVVREEWDVRMMDDTDALERLVRDVLK